MTASIERSTEYEKRAPIRKAHKHYSKIADLTRNMRQTASDKEDLRWEKGRIKNLKKVLLEILTSTVIPACTVQGTV